MADSVYDQSLDLIATQVKALADAVATWIVTESALTPRRMDWEDINSYPGLSLRFVDNPASFSHITEDTNYHSNVAYPAILCMHWNAGPHRDDRTKLFHNFLENTRAYYHHKRRLGAVSVTNVQENSTTVRNGGPTPPAEFKLNGSVEMLTIMCWFLEPRS